MCAAAIDSPTPVRMAVRGRLQGQVQGLGVRPSIALSAQELQLAGWVSNNAQGVELLVAGDPARVAEFQRRLREILPASATIEHVEWSPGDDCSETDFVIVRSEEAQQVSTQVPRDRAVCPLCLAEVMESPDRRRGYPFTSCTQCGPRYTILKRMPYERALTSMGHFEQCPACSREYTTPTDRRFHAQTNACPTCGPRVWCRTRSEASIEWGTSAMQRVRQVVKDGGIAAIQALGGYQLLADATQDAAVQQLRQRKRRVEKPFAVMVSTSRLQELQDCLSQVEMEVLTGSTNPILVCDRVSLGVSPAVTCGLQSLGVFGPATPLHALLLPEDGRPLVVTSANREGEPLRASEAEWSEQSDELADVVLHHDRLIEHPLDDSVVRVMAGRPVSHRLARGPAPLPIDVHSQRPGLAVGGHQKCSLALTNGQVAILGPHLGDLDTLAMRQRFASHVEELLSLYGCRPEFIVCDLHPDYFTTRWAFDCQDHSGTQAKDERGKEQKDQTHLPWFLCLREVIPVQHHHAHIAAGMIEQRWHDERVLGVAFDGTGYGPDGTIWGGEFLICTLGSYQRVAHLRGFRLSGGERAVREPWRSALSLASQILPTEEVFALLPARTSNRQSVVSDVKWARLSPHSSLSGPWTTSAGRLFDGIAALVLGTAHATFEGQPAIQLEEACDPAEPGAYTFAIEEGSPLVVDWRTVLREVIHDLRTGMSAGCIAMRFHRGLAHAVVDICRRFPGLPIVLSGGTFQNRMLTELLAERLSARRLGLPGVIPPNDGGLAAGQLAIAAERLRSPDQVRKEER